jgi:hypothetical protein
MRISTFTLLLTIFLINSCSERSNENEQNNKTRYEKWIADIDYFEKEFVDKSKTYSPDSAESCKTALKKLKLQIDSLDDNKIILEISRCIAMANNGHTKIDLNWMKKIPLRFYWFSDGLFVIKASIENAKFLGAKVLMIDSIDIEKVQNILNPYLSGNNNWKRYSGTNYLCSPEILNGIGATGKDSIMLTMTVNNDTISSWFKVSELKIDKSESEAWENLYPVNNKTSQENNVKHVLSDNENLPIYLQHDDKCAFYKFIDTLNIAYLNINKNVNKGVVLDELINEFLDSIKTSHVKKVVCDLRFNTGGNYMLTLKLSKKLPAYMPKNCKIYLITSNTTFSAGLVTAARLKYYAKNNLILVGDNVGDNLKFWSEEKAVKLPNSKLKLIDSKYEHDFIDDKFILFRTFWLDILYGVGVNNLTVDKKIQLTFEDYYIKKDPIYEWIIQQKE